MDPPASPAAAAQPADVAAQLAASLAANERLRQQLLAVAPPPPPANAAQDAAAGFPAGAPSEVPKAPPKPPRSAVGVADWESSSAKSAWNPVAHAPPRRAAGSFGEPDPNGSVKGLSKHWSQTFLMHPDKLKRTFTPEKVAELARFERVGRGLEGMETQIGMLVNNVPPDSEAIGPLLDIEEDIKDLLDDVKGGVDKFALQWAHSKQRYDAIIGFQNTFDPEVSAPACMLASNLEIEYQIQLADLKQSRKSLKEKPASEPRPGRARPNQHRDSGAASGAPKAPASDKPRFGRVGGAPSDKPASAAAAGASPK
jgi:hypothetical protein